MGQSGGTMAPSCWDWRHTSSFLRLKDIEHGMVTLDQRSVGYDRRTDEVILQTSTEGENITSLWVS